MPDFIRENYLVLLGQDILVLITAIVVAKLIQVVLVKLFRSQRLFRGGLALSVIGWVRRPMLWLLIFLALKTALPLTHLSEVWLARFQLILEPITVACLGWLVIGIARGTGEWLETHYPGKTRDSLGTRRFTTQLQILMRVIITVILVLTLIGMAMVIPTLRQLGMSLFASAGVAGIVLGIAAKETLSNLIAGAQLALTQQILLGDEVVVNNQSGVIDEITSSYVVLRTWDLRRLVIPLRYFMENAFENWTYHEPDLYGAVFLYADYTLDIGKLRTEAERVVAQSKFWDKKRCDLVVTESRENTLQVRASFSAKNSSDLGNLQSEVREKLITYLQREQPGALPKTRMMLEPAGSRITEL